MQSIIGTILMALLMIAIGTLAMHTPVKSTVTIMKTSVTLPRQLAALVVEATLELGLIFLIMVDELLQKKALILLYKSAHMSQLSLMSICTTIDLEGEHSMLLNLLCKLF